MQKTGRKGKPIPKDDEVSYHNHCLIVSSNALKRLFIERCTQEGFSPYEVAYLACGVKRRLVKEYWLNTFDPRVSKRFPQSDVVKMLEFVGIEIKITAILKPFPKENVEQLKSRLERFNE